MARDGSEAPKERISFTYRPAIEDAREEVELPLRILVIGDFTLGHEEPPLEERRPIPIDKNSFNAVMKEQNLKIEITVPDTLSGDADKEISLTLEFDSLDSMAPDAIAGKVPELSKLLELRGILTDLVWPVSGQCEAVLRLRALLTDEASSNAGASAELLLSWLSEDHHGASSQEFTEAVLAVIDQELSAQLDAVLHHPQVQKLESAWRSLKFLVDRTDFRENIKIDLLNVSKEAIQEDFERTLGDVTRSCLYKHVYAGEYRELGGRPYGYIIANYDFGPEAQDIQWLQNVAKVSAMSHAPFVAAAGPRFFGGPRALDSFHELSELKDLKEDFDGPRYVKWRSFRDSEDARYVALTVPRLLLRLPYGPMGAKIFNYEENVSAGHEQYLWGNAAFAFATRLTDSFAKHRWCGNIIGPGANGGQVEELPVHQFEAMGALQSKIPTEVLISDRRELELAEQGFIALVWRKRADNACFFSANSVQKPKEYGKGPEGRRAETNYRLGTQLPYMSLANRLAHYLKVIQRENLGSWQSVGRVQDELQKWLTQYVSDQENPSPHVISTRPLRHAKVTVEEVPGEVGWYKVALEVVPHFKFQGALFTLSLVGKLDRE